MSRIQLRLKDGTTMFFKDVLLRIEQLDPNGLPRELTLFTDEKQKLMVRESDQFITAFVPEHAVTKGMTREDSTRPADPSVHIAKFVDGPLDGLRFDTPEFPEKILIQFASGKTLRYENTCIGGEGEVVENEFALTKLPADYDQELKEDER